jgi:hypothetical protein
MWSVFLCSLLICVILLVMIIIEIRINDDYSPHSAISSSSLQRDNVTERMTVAKSLRLGANDCEAHKCVY